MDPFSGGVRVVECAEEGRGVRTSIFHESLEKFPDTRLEALMSWTAEEESSSAYGNLESQAGALGP